MKKEKKLKNKDKKGGEWEILQSSFWRHSNVGYYFTYIFNILDSCWGQKEHCGNVTYNLDERCCLNWELRRILKCLCVYFYSQLLVRLVNGVENCLFCNFCFPFNKYWHSLFSSPCLHVLKGTKINISVLTNCVSHFHSVM